MPRILRFALAAWFALISASISAGATPSQDLLLLGAAPVAIVHPVVNTDFTQGSLGSNYTYSGASLRTLVDATGIVTYAPNNLLLNSATLSTQSVTTSPINYIVSMYGTGSITLSGTSTGTITGTGSSNLVYLKITPTAGTLTLTVAGSVTSAVMAAVTYETAPRTGDAVVTTASAYYGPAFDYSPSSVGTPIGLRIEESRTNALPFSAAPTLAQGTSGSGWKAFHITTTAASLTGPDGLASGTIIADDATTNSHLFLPSTTPSYVAGTTYTLSVFAKQGTNNWIQIDVHDTTAHWINFDLNAGIIGNSSSVSSSNITAYPNGWYLLSITFTAVGTGSYETDFAIFTNNTNTVAPTPIYLGTGLNTFYVFGANLEVGAFPTSYNPSTGTASTRAADIVTLAGTALSTLQGTTWSAIAEFTSFNISNGPTMLGTSGASAIGVNSAGNGLIYNGTATTSTGNSAMWGSGVNRVGSAVSASRLSVSLDGGPVNSAALTYPSVTSAWLNSAGTGGFIDGHITKLAIYNSALVASQLRAKTSLAGKLSLADPINDNGSVIRMADLALVHEPRKAA